MTGAASTSASTAAGARRTAASITTTAGAFLAAEGATTRRAVSPVARSAIAGRSPSWVFGFEAQGDWAELQRQQRQPHHRRQHQPLADRCVWPVHRPGRLRLEHHAALCEGRRRRGRRSQRHPRPAARLSRRLRRQPLGRHRGRRHRILLRAELVGCVEYDHLFIGNNNTNFTTPARSVAG